MCRYLLNIVDVETLDAKKRKVLLKYLEERQAELDEKLACVNKALAAVRKEERAEKVKVSPSRLMEVMP
jgi:TfoX/Sxy family transcriptional regulator of competence genes